MRLLTRPLVTTLLVVTGLAVAQVSYAGPYDVLENHLRTRENIEENINERIREKIRDQARAKLRANVEEKVEEVILEQVSEAIEAAAEQALPAAVEHFEKEIDIAPGRTARVRQSKDFSDRIIEVRLSQVSVDIDRALESVTDREGNAALINEWLVMADRQTLRQLARSGYLVSDIEELKGLGYYMGRISAPATFKPGAERADLQILNSTDIAVDMNHVYFPQKEPGMTSVDSGTGEFNNTAGHWNKIGMIDSSIDLRHPVFKKARISEKRFTPHGYEKARDHGTAIASLLVGNSDEFHGLTPESQLFNGVIFASDKMGRVFSTTEAIIKALNWMAENDVRLVNMSLAGPDNAILKRAVSRACEQGTTLVSAAGNAGPMAPPLYPAAYACTIAVTAVDHNDQVYHRANRGDHIDFALPGVEIRHAIPDGQYNASSGTSYAAAIMTGLISASTVDSLSTSEIRNRFASAATDRGVAGTDPVYGLGALHVTRTSHTSASLTRPAD